MIRKVCIGIGIIVIVGIVIFYVMSNDSDVDSIEGISYRVPSEFEKSKYGVIFRKCANKVLKDYLLKGYAVN